jgi:hypothetical protein
MYLWSPLKWLTAASLAFGVASAGSTVANANFIAFQSNKDNGETKLFLPGNKDQTGTTFTAEVGHSGPQVTIDTTTSATVSHGFATIKPNGDTLTDITFTPKDPLAFADFSFRAQLLPVAKGDTLGDLVLKVTDDQGNAAQTFDLTTLFGPFKPNQDLTRLGVFSADETIKSIEITDSTGFKEVKQMEFSTAPVPLPPAVALFASGLVGLGFLSRRRRKAPVAPIA